MRNIFYTVIITLSVFSNEYTEKVTDVAADKRIYRVKHLNAVDSESIQIHIRRQDRSRKAPDAISIFRHCPLPSVRLPITFYSYGLCKWCLQPERHSISF